MLQIFFFFLLEKKWNENWVNVLPIIVSSYKSVYIHIKLYTITTKKCKKWQIYGDGQVPYFFFHLFIFLFLFYFLCHLLSSFIYQYFIYIYKRKFVNIIYINLLYHNDQQTYMYIFDCVTTYKNKVINIIIYIIYIFLLLYPIYMYIINQKYILYTTHRLEW